MEPLGTVIVCTVRIAPGVIVGAVWGGGPEIGIHVEADGRTSQAASWRVWNDAWDTPLIEATRESFQRFVVGRLSEPGVVEELVEMTAA